MEMFQLSKGEIHSVLNLLKELRDGSLVEDVESDIIENIEMLEAILNYEQ